MVFASIMCSGKRVSAAGRGGLGAVLGAKNCAERLAALLKERGRILRQNAKALTELGTPRFLMAPQKGVLVRTNNFSNN